MSGRLSLKEFIDNIRFQIGGVPSEAVMDYAMLSAIDVARKTWCLVRTENLDAWSGVKEYALPKLQDEEVIAVKSVYLGERHIPNAVASVGYQCWQADIPDRFYLNNAPEDDCKGGLQVSLVAVPQRRASYLDKDFAEKYDEIITNGALYRLYQMAGQAWHNPEAAAQIKQLYDNAILTMRTERLIGRTGSRMRVPYRRFG